MARKRSAPKAKAKAPSPGKKRATKRAPSAASRTDDVDIFIPPTFAGTTKPKAKPVQPLNDDDDVFIPASFKFPPPDPIEDQLRELSARGLDEHGRCKYGCRLSNIPKADDVLKAAVDALDLEAIEGGEHDANCPYWNREGKDRTPF